MWGGFVNSYYKLRWQFFEFFFLDVIVYGILFDSSKFNVVVLEYEIQWIYDISLFLDSFVGDILIIVKNLYVKYRLKKD